MLSSPLILRYDIVPASSTFTDRSREASPELPAEDYGSADVRKARARAMAAMQAAMKVRAAEAARKRQAEMEERSRLLDEQEKAAVEAALAQKKAQFEAIAKAQAAEKARAEAEAKAKAEAEQARRAEAAARAAAEEQRRIAEKIAAEEKARAEEAQRIREKAIAHVSNECCTELLAQILGSEVVHVAQEVVLEDHIAQEIGAVLLDEEFKSISWEVGRTVHADAARMRRLEVCERAVRSMRALRRWRHAAAEAGRARARLNFPPGPAMSFVRVTQRKNSKLRRVSSFLRPAEESESRNRDGSILQQSLVEAQSRDDDLQGALRQRSEATLLKQMWASLNPLDHALQQVNANLGSVVPWKLCVCPATGDNALLYQFVHACLGSDRTLQRWRGASRVPDSATLFRDAYRDVTVSWLDHADPAVAREFQGADALLFLYSLEDGDGGDDSTVGIAAARLEELLSTVAMPIPIAVVVCGSSRAVAESVCESLPNPATDSRVATLMPFGVVEGDITTVFVSGAEIVEGSLTWLFANSSLARDTWHGTLHHATSEIFAGIRSRVSRRARQSPQFFVRVYGAVLRLLSDLLKDYTTTIGEAATAHGSEGVPVAAVDLNTKALEILGKKISELPARADADCSAERERTDRRFAALGVARVWFRRSALDDALSAFGQRDAPRKRQAIATPLPSAAKRSRQPTTVTPQDRTT